MKSILIIILLAGINLLIACGHFFPPVPGQDASTHLPDPSKESHVPVHLPPQDLPFQQAAQEDQNTFMKGLRQLAELASAPDDLSQARQIFERVITAYPKSAWYDAAVVCLDLINKLDALHDTQQQSRVTLRKLFADKEAQLQEIEHLKMEIRTLQEKYQSELFTLQQENEQMKKDIQLLKNLELQLDRREKQLR